MESFLGHDEGRSNFASVFSTGSERHGCLRNSAGHSTDRFVRQLVAYTNICASAGCRHPWWTGACEERPGHLSIREGTTAAKPSDLPALALRMARCFAFAPSAKRKFSTAGLSNDYVIPFTATSLVASYGYLCFRKTYAVTVVA